MVLSNSEFPREQQLAQSNGEVERLQEETLYGYLRHWAVHQGGSAAVVHGDQLITYEALEREVRSTAAGLARLGVGKGDVVAAQLPNIPEFIITYLATCALGGVFQPLHMPYRCSELRYLLRDSSAKIVVCLAEVKGELRAQQLVDLQQELPKLEQVVVVGDWSVAGVVTMQDLRAENPLEPEAQISEEDLFLLLYTSGTTSKPKGVPIRYRAFLSNARLSLPELGITASDRLLSAAAMSHLYGLAHLHLALIAGAAVVLLPEFSPEQFLEGVRCHAPTAVFAAPAHLISCLEGKLLRQGDFENTRFICFSGTRVPEHLARKVDSLLPNGDVLQLWGMSEVQIGAFTRTTDTPYIRCATTGFASPGTELRVVGDGGRTLPAGEEGELEIRGDSVFQGYLNKPVETADAFTEDGWFRTGDMAVLGESGCLTITGRSKEVINRGGVKYNPVEIELLITEMDAIAQCAIVPLPDPVLGERACVVVVGNPGCEVTLEEIKAYLLRAEVAKYKWPEQLRLIDAMPLTPTRKVQKGILIAQMQK